MKILVTRPEPQASEWVGLLRAAGEQAEAVPLIEIGPPPDATAVPNAWAALPDIRLVMFVSPNAALWFARQRPASLPWPRGTLAAAPGPGTATTVLQCLADAGLATTQLISPDANSAQFDSEHLWPLLAPLPWADQHVLIVSGGDQGEARGRQWLTERLRERGAQVSAVLTYQRRPARWTPAQQEQADQAHAHPAEHVWLLSSSEAVEHLQQAWSAHGGLPPGAKALATHPRVAETARAAGFTHVHDTRPTPEAVALARRTWSGTTD
ncbi:MAG TPA: uroporphyrinogen-III synthase [Candidatus Aquabacterium excrementipullorum]|nr:uroporphyrinogen-III synthase [Candidatus Aquabacterium excrementipullorum]